MTHWYRIIKQGLLWFLAGLILTCSTLLIPSFTSIAYSTTPVAQQSQQLYQAGEFSQAAQVLEEALENYQKQGDTLQQAITLSNLSLVYEKLGYWSQAETAINQSLKLLENNNSSDAVQIIAQTLNRQGNLQFAQGNVKQALSTWEQAEDTYKNLGDTAGQIQSRINQAQALQSLGFYRRALNLLSQVQENLAQQSDSITKATSWRFLGNVLLSLGDFEKSDAALQNSLTVARNLQSPQQISAALLSLGNTASSQQKTAKAINLYEQAAQVSISPLQQVQAQLNQLSLLIEKPKDESISQLVKQIEFHLKQLTPNRYSIQAQINFANTLMRSKLRSASSLPDTTSIARYLAQARIQAQNLGDKRAESNATGTLGSVYEQNQQWELAQKLTQQALTLAETINAPDLSYLWQWQMGRLLHQLGDDDGAIAAYDSAIDILKFLRNDLVAVNSEVQFSFRESVEPVYRQLVSLLLEEDYKANNNAKNLEKARKVIESLQLAELDNFFRSACLDSIPVAIENVDQQAAVIYPIILPDRLEVIVRIPNQSLRHYATKLTQAEVEKKLLRLRTRIVNSGLVLTTNSQRSNNPQDYLPALEEVYNWLVRPVEADLATNEVNTIVFILDGVLRNLPMAALYDGEKYLAQNYAIGVTPGLELLEAKSLQKGQAQVLAAGLSQARQGFKPLPGVESELEQITTQIPAEILLNQEFTENNIQAMIDAVPFPVVHLATHGQFSSKAENTFILTWDGKINVNELDGLLRTQEFGGDAPIELLVFSACQTAKGDPRAALGIAGVALKAGARSTVASLWSVDDEATASMMVKFYQELANPEITKAQALRRAQMAVLEDSKYQQHPYFWAPFIVVGNWL